MVLNQSVRLSPESPTESPVFRSDRVHWWLMLFQSRSDLFTINLEYEKRYSTHSLSSLGSPALSPSVDLQTYWSPWSIDLPCSSMKSTNTEQILFVWWFKLSAELERACLVHDNVVVEGLNSVLNTYWTLWHTFYIVGTVIDAQLETKAHFRAFGVCANGLLAEIRFSLWT